MRTELDNWGSHGEPSKLKTIVFYPTALLLMRLLLTTTLGRGGWIRLIPLLTYVPRILLNVFVIFFATVQQETCRPVRISRYERGFDFNRQFGVSSLGDCLFRRRSPFCALEVSSVDFTTTRSHIICRLLLHSCRTASCGPFTPQSTRVAVSD